MSLMPEDMKGSSELSTACRKTIGGQECRPSYEDSFWAVPIVKWPKSTHPTVPRLSPLAVETPLPFSSISVNLIMGLPNSHGFDLVMVMVDHGLTKRVIYCLCTKNIAAVTRSVVKVILGSAKTRQAILTKRPMSFWA